MGKVIWRTVTITITETWTIVWTDAARADDKPQPQATPIVQEQPKPQAEEAATILPALTTIAAADAQPNDVTPKPSAGSQRKHTRRRNARNQ